MESVNTMTNPHDLSWALSTIKRIATLEERERIIKILIEWYGEELNEHLLDHINEPLI
jgi:hypothetical protein